ncbi:uncharacterized protein PV07_08736 [Cladophialophora immunda]|uniref:HNH nuclease domain-containing protein n=1 Tax=Cladophialophora immunda TaxID=569365 RepID=A0A0D2C549_9EURO|nr:uncharacterized protein PV07_08736 [Cladophialophora immunda]KIW25570.1 hypothetical protein PV07_08736 [Cladophialophora immunda]OQV07678.1 hypothetical protein CLAIMM_12078 [Cladophialophora immunda]
MASTNGPEAEFSDPERIRLIQTLKDKMGEIQPTAWACLWLSDIEKLRGAAGGWPTALMAMAFHNMECDTKLAQAWAQRKRAPVSTASTPQRVPTPQASATPIRPPQAQPSSAQSSPALSPLADGRRGQKRTVSGRPISTPLQPIALGSPSANQQFSPSGGRSKSQRERCYQRDQMKCVLTKAGDPIEVAHIYPFSLQIELRPASQQSGTSFWTMLRMFWSDERVDAWFNALFPHGTETCQNLIGLCPNAHAYWGKAYFALKPIQMSDDKKRLDIEFHWLSSNPYAERVDLAQVPSLAITDHGPNETRLFDVQTLEVISSGQQICLTTDDPELRPLPNMKLLEMQWYLHRVTAMSGAGDLPDDFFHQSDDEDDVGVDFEDDQGRGDTESDYEWDTDRETWARS